MMRIDEVDPGGSCGSQRLFLHRLIKPNNEDHPLEGRESKAGRLMEEEGRVCVADGAPPPTSQ